MSLYNDVAHMREAVLFEGTLRGQKLSRFWILLVLAALIAAAGVVADSTATVIGAMIVAPMLLPIQGTMLSTVLGDRVNLARSVTLIVLGAAVAVAIAFVVGLLDPNPVTAAVNSQVEGRVTPGLIDLLAALATGVVGSIALVRKDISDTLPGVAIAISLVPPLSVVGLTLESHALGEAMGALLLFLTNVGAILVTGVVVVTIFRFLTAHGRVAGSDLGRGGSPIAIAVIVVMLAIICIPLTLSSIDFTKSTVTETTTSDVAQHWARDAGWDLVSVTTSGSTLIVRATGALPTPDTAPLESALKRAGIDTSNVEVELVPSYTERLSNSQRQ